jgi:ABC-type glycerol-3-phosphate transport system substrate-binding protein
LAASFRSKAVHIVLAPVLASAIAASACGGGDSGGGGGGGLPPTRTLNSVTVSGGSTVQAGQTVQFTATGNFSSAPTTENVSTQATWESSNTGVATVNGTGLATGVAAGNADIRARFQNVQGSAPLAVTSPALAAIFRVVVPNTNDTDVCRIIQNSGGDWDCEFNGSASTGGTGGNINQWTWRFDVGPSSGGPFVRTDPVFRVDTTCNYFANGRPGQAGPGFVQVVVKLVVRNAAGESSAETINSNVRLFPQNQCGFGF